MVVASERRLDDGTNIDFTATGHWEVMQQTVVCVSSPLLMEPKKGVNITQLNGSMGSLSSIFGFTVDLTMDIVL